MASSLIIRVDLIIVFYIPRYCIQIINLNIWANYVFLIDCNLMIYN